MFEDACFDSVLDDVFADVLFGDGVVHMFVVGGVVWVVVFCVVALDVNCVWDGVFAPCVVVDARVVSVFADE